MMMAVAAAAAGKAAGVRRVVCRVVTQAAGLVVRSLTRELAGRRSSRSCWIGLL